MKKHQKIWQSLVLMPLVVILPSCIWLWYKTEIPHYAIVGLSVISYFATLVFGFSNLDKIK